LNQTRRLETKLKHKQKYQEARQEQTSLKPHHLSFFLEVLDKNEKVSINNLNEKSKQNIKYNKKKLSHIFHTYYNYVSTAKIK
jgi:hypothetical protein